jgi:glycosyltransferase involved in cell wall biosynthesis
VKVLHLVHQYLPEFVGGTELYTQALTHALAQQGWETAIFHRAYRDSRSLSVEVTTGIPIFAAAAGPISVTHRFLATWRHPLLHRHWAAALDAFQPDLVHVQHLMGLPTSLIGLLQKRRIPYVVTLLDYWWLCANANLLTNYDQRPCHGPQAYLNCTRCAVARTGRSAAWGAAPALWTLLADRSRKLNEILDHADALLAPSDFVRRWYTDHGAPAHHLQTARWGVIPPDTAYTSRRQDGAPLALLYVGGIAPNKGVHTVLEALRGVSGNLRLSIAGDTSTHPDYAAQLRRIADSRVTFLGRLSRNEVWQAMANADAVVVPSLWHETFCLVAHEALMAGAPVLASAMGALTEAVRDGVDGLLLPPGDVSAWRQAIQHLVNQPQTLQQLRTNVVAPRQFDEHVEQVESIYRQVLGSAT